jgi:hypothetical protein
VFPFRRGCSPDWADAAAPKATKKHPKKVEPEAEQGQPEQA